MTKWLPFAIAGAFAAWILFSLLPRHDEPGAFAVQEFGRLPVVANGRTQPLDSLARNSLLQLREKQNAALAPWENGDSISATEWIMEMTMNPAVADSRPVFRIDHPELKGLL